MGGDDDTLKNLKVGPALHKQVKAYAASHGISLQEMTERALLIAMESELPPRPPAREECILTGLAEQHRKTLTALAWLLREGHEAEMVEIVRRVIAVAEKKARKDA
jgi:hypothetical protein